MADVEIDSGDWGVLQQSTNAYVPRFVQALIDDGARRVDVAKHGKKMSPQFVAKVLDRKAVSHRKAKDLVAAWNGYAEGEPLVQLTEDDIVIAVFVLPTLKAELKRVKVAAEDLAATGGLSKGAIEHCLDGGRITGGMVCAVHRALVQMGATPPSITYFAITDEDKGSRTVDGRPFKLKDLLMPLDSPSPWPITRRPAETAAGSSQVAD